MKIWIVCIAKHEELYIREWVEHNKKIGIDHIILGDNNDSDYEHPIKPIIQDYIDEGYIEYIDLKDQYFVQQSLYNQQYLKNRDKFDWCGFIDIDEFVNIPKHSNIQEFLSDERFNGFDAVILPWMNMTDNDQIYYEDRPVVERFTKFTKYNIYVVSCKYFIKSLDKIEKIPSKHCPKKIKTNDNSIIECCDSLGKTSTFLYKKPNSFTSLAIYEHYYDDGHIKHYMSKSTEEYIKYKMIKVLAADSTHKDHKHRYTEEYYFTKNPTFHSKELLEKKKQLFAKYREYVNSVETEYFERYNKNVGRK